ncbi:MAG TPA: DUF5678 domain-containing protein [Blastocatellia bacterium]|nr:DUF5678 domain-containing protein [Blastocatellia bacterium]
MTLTIDVPIELEQKLEAEAKRRGIGRDEYVRVMLEENLKQTAPRRQPPFPAKIIATDLPVRDRSREYAWLEQHSDEYDGKYVALDGDKLLAVGDGAKEVATKARELGVQGALIVYVEGSNQPRFISGGVSWFHA